jgi:hypothetical protein
METKLLSFYIYSDSALWHTWTKQNVPSIRNSNSPSSYALFLSFITVSLSAGSPHVVLCGARLLVAAWVHIPLWSVLEAAV